MKRALSLTAALFDRAFTLLVRVAAALAALMMAVIFVNVVMRYLLARPLHGAFEATEIGMGLIVFFALPKMIRAGGNIRVTILFDRLPPGARRRAGCATDLLGAAICGFVAWRMWLYGGRLLTYNEVTMELGLPKGIVAQAMAALLLFAAAAFLINAAGAPERRPETRPETRPGARPDAAL